MDLPQLPTLRTERLILRPFEITDAQAVTTLLEDIRIHQCTLNIPYPYQLPMAYQWIASHVVRYLQRTDVVLAITAENGEVMGTIGINMDMRHLSGEVGFWMGHKFRKNGYCSEALLKMISYAFNKIKLNRLHASYFDWNEASGRVLYNCGFKKEGLLLKAVRKQGKFNNLVLTGLLEEDWNQNE